MGHLLSHPVTSKFTNRRGNAYFRCGAAEMQGFRITMEDTHNLILRTKAHASGGGDTTNTDTNTNDFAFFAVYDGHSGPACSEFAAKEIPARIGKLSDPFNKDAVTKAIIATDVAFCANTSVRSHGSTACFAIVQPLAANAGGKRQYRVLVGNLGDSRCLVVSAEGRIRLTTNDHKPDTESEAKRIHAAGGTVSFGRVDGELAMSRSLGDYTYKGAAHLAPALQKVIAVPDIEVIDCVEGEKLILMCDGLVEKASNEQIVQFVESELTKNRSDPAAIASAMLDFSLEKGSKDNMSAMVVLLEDGTDYHDRDEYVPGLITNGEDDRKFIEAYMEYAKSHGIEPWPCLQMARKAEQERSQARANGRAAATSAASQPIAVTASSAAGELKAVVQNRAPP